MRYGNDAEPLLRSFFALDHPEYRVSFTPYKIIKHQDLPFITCTPDGELEEIATGRLGGLEIKTTEMQSKPMQIKEKQSRVKKSKAKQRKRKQRKLSLRASPPATPTCFPLCKTSRRCGTGLKSR